MFRELAALAQHSPLLLLVSREGERLRVNLTRREDKAGETKALSLSILATAEELDAELPLALAEGLAMHDAPATMSTVAEQVTLQVETKKKRRRRHSAPTNTPPEGGTSAGSGEPTAMSAPAPESGTGAGVVSKAATQVGEALQPGETRESDSPRPPLQGHEAPAATRDPQPPDLFS